MFSTSVPGEDDQVRFSPLADPPPFNLFGDGAQDDDSDTMSEEPTNQYQNLDNEGGNLPASIQNTLQEDYIQDPDLDDVYDVPHLSDSGSGKTLVLSTQRMVNKTGS